MLCHAMRREALAYLHSLAVEDDVEHGFGPVAA